MNRRQLLKALGLAALAAPVTAATGRPDLPPVDVPDVRTWHMLTEGQRADVTAWLERHGRTLDNVVAIRTVDVDSDRAVVEIEQIHRDRDGKAHLETQCAVGSHGDAREPEVCRFVDRITV